jgi:YidC/Oxa1 family membrane protein insertase
MHFFSLFYHEVIYRPLLNGLVFIYAHLPYHDLGIAILILTILVRLILHPTVVSTVRTQIVMPRVQVRLKEIQKKYKDNKEEQARQSMATYKEFGIHPLSSIAPLLIQIPIFIGLFQVFRTGILLKDSSLLYSFIPAIGAFNPIAFGIFDFTKRNIALALTSGISQYLQGRYSPKPPDLKETGTDDFARAMRWQVTYFFPVFFTGIALFMPSALPFYWTVLNLLAIVQQLWIQKSLAHEPNSGTNQPNTREDGGSSRSGGESHP